MAEVMEEYCRDEGGDSERAAEDEETGETKTRSEGWRKMRLQMVGV